MREEPEGVGGAEEDVVEEEDALGGPAPSSALASPPAPVSVSRAAAVAFVSAFEGLDDFVGGGGARAGL